MRKNVVKYLNTRFFTAGSLDVQDSYSYSFLPLPLLLRVLFLDRVDVICIKEYEYFRRHNSTRLDTPLMHLCNQNVPKKNCQTSCQVNFVF